MNAYSVPSVPPILPKNTSPKTRAAADPNRKKSYHSVAVPIRLANTTLVIERLLRSTPGLVSVVMGVPFWGRMVWGQMVRGRIVRGRIVRGGSGGAGLRGGP